MNHRAIDCSIEEKIWNTLCETDKPKYTSELLRININLIRTLRSYDETNWCVVSEDTKNPRSERSSRYIFLKFFKKIILRWTKTLRATNVFNEVYNFAKLATDALACVMFLSRILVSDKRGL